VTSAWRALRQRAEVLSLVLLALVPALWSSPGRLPADTKLYWYLDPGRLVADARWSWDPRQFAGWVPHQTISYLWPSGPWYAVWDALGVPDWIAHRMWWALLLASAGLGARWAARHLGITAHAAWVVGAVYQCSPYVLAYLSRTSLMLAPYAALGWLIGLTVRSASRGGWRDAGLFALVVATVAAPNATATAMIAPAPLLWLILAGTSGDVAWRRVAATTARLGGLSLAVSTWWIAMLSVQGRYGADVLGYSETLEDVALTATSTEVLRGLGYWLFYVRDAFTFATTASLDYQASTRTLVTSLALLGVGIAGLALTRWTHRRYATGLVVIGVLLAVGVYPIDDPSPLMSPVADRSRSALALAFRSSTRAVPLVVFALALATGAVVMAFATWWRRRTASDRGVWVGMAVVLLAVINIPALWRAQLVDPALERDQTPPAAWLAAAQALDRRAPGYRVLQVPGAEFGAFRWGYTVDPPLPGLTTRALVTRDLLPLGSPAAMDLLYALDDRMQEGVLEAASVGPVARLLAADVVWVTNDAAHDRFATARPHIVADLLTREGSGLGAVSAFGAPEVHRAQRPTLDNTAIVDERVGRALPPVLLIDVPDPQPIMRAGVDTVILAGNGDGIVDAAAVGLLDLDSVVRYAAHIPTDTLQRELTTTRRVIVTDTDRRRAHHWRSSQRVWGFTEDDGPEGGVLQPVSGDQRLPVFDRDRANHHTIARQVGDLTAVASAYGAPFSYLPEQRAWRAVDGDVHSAWLVAEGVDATGAFLRLRSDDPVTHLTLVQPLDGRRRWISAVDIVVDGVAVASVELDASSRTAGGQRIEWEREATVIDLVIQATEQVAPGWEARDSVGFAEVRLGEAPTEETVVMRSPALTDTPAHVPMDVVMTRWRVNPLAADRDDPEPSMDRSFHLGTARVVRPEFTVRLNRRAADATLAALWQWSGAEADRRLEGDPMSGGWSALDGDDSTAWRTPLGGARGAHWTAPLEALSSLEGSTRDDPALHRLTLTQVTDSRHALITEVDVIVDDAPAVTLTVPPPDAAGVSHLDIGELLTDPSSRSLTVVIRSTDGASTLAPLTARPVELPTGIIAIDHPRLARTALPAALDTGCRDDLVTLNGEGLTVRVQGSWDALVTGEPAHVTLCGEPLVAFDARSHRLVSRPGALTGLDIDRVVLHSAIAPPRAVTARPDVNVVSGSRIHHHLQVGPCEDGCWVVHGEGHNIGWAASSGGVDLGEPHVVDGGFNGWWLEASSEPREVHLHWTPQRQVDLGLVISMLAVLGCLGLVVWDRRRFTEPMAVPAPVFTTWGPVAAQHHRLRDLAVWSLFTVGAMATIEPRWGAVAGGITLVALWWRRPQWTGLLACIVMASLAVTIVWRVRRDRPFPGPLWTAEFADLHRPGLLVVALLVGSLLAQRPAR
jgi:arabinofuranan 3-O-arabinosyltransferase